MYTEASESNSTHAQVEVLLDGLPVRIPFQRRSLSGICAHVDSVALGRQRVLTSLHVDGEPVDLAQPLPPSQQFASVEYKSINLEQLPLHLVEAALDQIKHAREQIHAAVVYLLLNDGCAATEFCWQLARRLKAPVLTLSLLPNTICGAPDGGASLTQLRRWQLEQIANIITDVNEACWSGNQRMLFNALENRALPWLNQLQNALALLHETLQAGAHSHRYAA